jgi:hypothetical protein
VKRKETFLRLLSKHNIICLNKEKIKELHLAIFHTHKGKKKTNKYAVKLIIIIIIIIIINNTKI